MIKRQTEREITIGIQREKDRYQKAKKKENEKERKKKRKKGIEREIRRNNSDGKRDKRK